MWAELSIVIIANFSIIYAFYEIRKLVKNFRAKQRETIELESKVRKLEEGRARDMRSIRYLSSKVVAHPKVENYMLVKDTYFADNYQSDEDDTNVNKLRM